jgi:hypothetical protein
MVFFILPVVWSSRPSSFNGNFRFESISLSHRRHKVCQTGQPSPVLSPKGFPPRRNGRFCLALA